MKNYVYIIAFTIITFLYGYADYQYEKAKKYQALYEVAEANNKAYESDLACSQDEAKAYQLTLEDLKMSNDSLVKELIKVQKDKKIKDKEVQSMAYQLSKASRVDTIRMKDTIFVSNLRMDTTITDKWYTLSMSMEYPSTVTVNPTFSSERYIIVNAKRETINKPSKIFFIRWFQKKHTVINVDVEEKNPYINIDKQKFIKVIK